METASPGGRADGLAACQKTELDLVLNSACTIGDKTFQFSATAWLSAIPANDVIFTPDASNSNSPGFLLSEHFTHNTVATFILTSGATELDELDQLNYSVSLTDPASGKFITGVTTTQTGASISWTDSSNNLQALAGGFLDAGLCNVFAEAGLIVQDSTLFLNSTTASQDSLAAQGCTDVTQVKAEAQIFLVAQNGVTSLVNGGFYVDEADASVPTVPERGSLLLLASGLLGCLFIRKLST